MTSVTVRNFSIGELSVYRPALDSHETFCKKPQNCSCCSRIIRKTATHCCCGAEVRVRQRALKHDLLFIQNVHISPLEKLQWSTEPWRYSTVGRLKKTKSTETKDLADDNVPAVLAFVSWAGCPPLPFCASSPQDSGLCSCSGSFCSCPWPDWLTVLTAQRHTDMWSSMRKHVTD